MSAEASAATTLRRPPAPTAIWLRRFLIVLTVLGLIALAGVVFWLAGLIAAPLSMLGISALIAYIMYPAVARLSQYMPRWLAILVVFLGLTVALGVVIIGVLQTLRQQVGTLIQTLNSAAQPQNLQHLRTLLGPLGGIVSPGSVRLSGQQLAAALQAFVGSLLGLTGSVFVMLMVLLIVVTFIVYLLVTGPRSIVWVRQQSPLRWRGRVNFFLDAADGVLGGFLRGAIVLACLMGTLTGAGAYLLGIHTWLLIAVIVFICEFIPMFGAYISGFLGTLLALTQGWEVGLIYLVYATFLQGFLDAHVFIPRIIGKHTGVHPLISTFVLLVGFVLFGVMGVILAIPITAVSLILLRAAWKTYQHEHPEEFAARATEPPLPGADVSAGASGPQHAGGENGIVPVALPAAPQVPGAPAVG